MRCGCYVRVSTENQIENYSIEEQIDRLKAYCMAKDYTNYSFYTDAGYSGGNTNRPALQNLMKDIDQGLIHLVIVYKLDRLSRSQKDTLMLIEDKFISNNVDFISINENFDTTTAFGRAMIGILSVFAQLEKDQITERFTMGRIGRAKNGLYHGGSTIPTGYDYIDGKLVINQYEALQVKEVFRRFNSGQSICSIQKYMSTHYTTKHGNWSSESLVRKILENNLYIGKIKFNGEVYEGQHEPIISDTDFIFANNLLHSKNRFDHLSSFQKTPFRAHHLLTSKIICGKCGARFAGEHGNYTCYSRSKGKKQLIKDPNCKNKRWKIVDLDRYVLDKLEHLDFDLYEDEARPLDLTHNYEKIQTRISDIEKQMERMIDLYQVGTIPITEIHKRIGSLSQEKEQLVAILNELDQNNRLTIRKSVTIHDRLIDIKDSDNLDEKRLLIGILIDHIEINDENVEIFLNL